MWNLGLNKRYQEGYITKQFWSRCGPSITDTSLSLSQYLLQGDWQAVRTLFWRVVIPHAGTWSPSFPSPSTWYWENTIFRVNCLNSLIAEGEAQMFLWSYLFPTRIVIRGHSWEGSWEEGIKRGNIGSERKRIIKNTLGGCAPLLSLVFVPTPSQP